MANLRAVWRHIALAAMLVAAMGAARAGAQSGEEHGVVRENMDPSVKPGDDFFRYSNGVWIERAEIPADRPNIGVFLTLRNNCSIRISA